MSLPSRRPRRARSAQSAADRRRADQEAADLAEATEDITLALSSGGSMPAYTPGADDAGPAAGPIVLSPGHVEGPIAEHLPAEVLDRLNQRAR